MKQLLLAIIPLLIIATISNVYAKGPVIESCAYGYNGEKRTNE